MKKLLLTSIILSALSFNSLINASPVTSPTTVPVTQSSSLNPLTDPSTDLLAQIRDLVQNISNFFGLNLDQNSKIPTTPPTPNLAQMQAIPNAINQNLQGKTLLYLNSQFNSSIDQAPNTSPPLSLNQRAIYNGLTTQNDSPVLSYMAGLGISAQAASTPVAFPGGNTQTPSPNPNDENLNFEALVSPNAFSNDTAGATQELQAMNFIRFSSGQANPIAIPDFSSLKDVSVDQKNAFIVGLREYIALRSVATSNFYQMLAQRHLVQGLGKKAGMTDAQGNPINDASPMQVEDYFVSQRVLNPQWYQSMEKASPITVQRETLYVLAEMQRTMNDMQKTNERLLATLSAIELIAAQNMKTGLNMSKNNFSPPPALPQPTTPPTPNTQTSP